MHLHIVGIGGTFMGGLARLAVAAGHRVSGCDHALYPPMSDQLAALRVDILDGFGLNNLAVKPDVWVIGNVARRGMPVVEAILDQGLPHQSGPQWLREHVLRFRHVLAVAGTHGKTTTSSMLAWILDHTGHAPGFLIGGVPEDFGVSSRLGEGKYFVIEADEYDTAFFDKRSKFLHYPARTAILNNLEFDHADIFPDLAAIETQFHHWVRTLPSQARIILPAGEAALERVLARGCWSGVQRVGASAGRGQQGEMIADHSPANRWEVAEVDTISGGFSVMQAGTRLARVEAMVPGDHNRRNALAAMAAASHVGVSPSDAARALAAFRGVARRLQIRGSAGGVLVIDDFAHHPTAIAATLDALTSQGKGRILAVLEPRSNTMQLGVMASRLASALNGADLVFGYTGGLNWDLPQALAPLGERAATCDRIDTLVGRVVAASRPGDRILVMSNGSFGGIHEKLLQALGTKGLER